MSDEAMKAEWARMTDEQLLTEQRECRLVLLVLMKQHPKWMPMPKEARAMLNAIVTGGEEIKRRGLEALP